MSDKHLTSTNPELEELVRNTPRGMAHWSGTGPADATCGKCRFLVKDRCSEFAQMMSKQGGKIPPETPACRYFERMRKTA